MSLLELRIFNLFFSKRGRSIPRRVVKKTSLLSLESALRRYVTLGSKTLHLFHQLLVCGIINSLRFPY